MKADSTQQLFSEVVYFNRDSGELVFNPLAKDAYRNNAYAGANRALSISFPTAKQLVGEDFFYRMTSEYHLKKQSSLGDWGEYGAEFVEEFSNYEVLDEFPYLCDVARIDWAIHKCERAANKPLHLESIAQLANTDPYQTWFDLSPGLSTLGSLFPALAIWKAHLTDGNDRRKLANKVRVALANIEELGTNEYNRECYVIWRKHYKGLVAHVDRHTIKWIELIQQVKSLGECLDLVEKEQLNFEIWLNEALKHQFVFGIKVGMKGRVESSADESNRTTRTSRASQK